jgi:3',5'-cyclic-AMP phosphodiesterase
LKHIFILTDLHLQRDVCAEIIACYEKNEISPYIQNIAVYALSGGADTVIFLGDITNSAENTFAIQGVFTSAFAACGLRFAYILGNHDFYLKNSDLKSQSLYRKINQIRARIGEVSAVYLTNSLSAFFRGEDYAYIGVDGWASGNGDIYSSIVRGFQDFDYIQDFKGLPLEQKIQIMREESVASAKQVAHQFACALEASSKLKRFVIFTHVSPFTETCFYQGQLHSTDAFPVFWNAHMGGEIRRMAREYPHISFEVYSGHTHAYGSAQISPNLKAITLSAYGANQNLGNGLFV